MNPVVKFLARMSYQLFGFEVPDKIWDCSAKLRAWLTPLWLPLTVAFLALRIVWSAIAWSGLIFFGLWPIQPKWLLANVSDADSYPSPVYPWHLAVIGWIGSLVYAVWQMTHGVSFYSLPGWPQVVFGCTAFFTIMIGNIAAVFGLGTGVDKLWSWRSRKIQQSCHLVDLK